VTIRLRAHHFLCLLTYVGKGYNQAFIENFDRVIRKLSLEAEILIVEGPDDICAPMLDTQDPHCWRASVTRRDQSAAADLERLLKRSFQAGNRLVLEKDLLAQMREAFAEGSVRTGCRKCQWFDFCSAIASGDEAQESPKILSGSTMFTSD
jgi:uncharacterized protein